MFDAGSSASNPLHVVSTCGIAAAPRLALVVGLKLTDPEPGVDLQEVSGQLVEWADALGVMPCRFHTAVVSADSSPMVAFPMSLPIFLEYGVGLIQHLHSQWCDPDKWDRPPAKRIDLCLYWKVGFGGVLYEAAIPKGLLERGE